MSGSSANRILEAAAKTLGWEIYLAGSCSRPRAHVNVEKFERELLSAAREWKAARANLKGQRRTNGNKGKQ